MKFIRLSYYIVFLLFPVISFSQNISVSSNAFSDQQLVEDVLFDTNCVGNINVTNTVSGNFSNGELSYGFFDANNSNFPFDNGIVLTTGRLSNVPGPNNSLSDDDAPNWSGDQDLENSLGITNTINATIFEFSFVPQANSISFRYIFASEEYRENNSSTCNFSDAFAFLIRPIGGQFQNLALVPGTNTPVQVTTVRPEIPGACDAINEEFFGQFNDVDAPINFNGETAILTAESDVVAGQTYEIKLVIADETNFRFDSAVFIEGNSFNVGVDLGQDQTLCQGETLNLQIDNDEATSIRWFFEGQLINDTDNNITVSEDAFGEGQYSVEADLPSGCTAIDEVQINFDQISLPQDLSLNTCIDANGFGVFNLFDVSNQIDNSLQILNFYLTQNEAELGVNPIQNPNTFENTTPNQNVFIRVLNANNCTAVESVQLIGNTQVFDQITFTVCPVQETSPTSFTNQAIQNQVLNTLGVQAENIDLYFSEEDAINQNNLINTGFIEIETELLPLTIFARVEADNSCLGLVPVVLQKIDAPIFSNVESEFLICENSDDNITLDASIVNAHGEIFYEWNTGETTENIQVSEAGSFSVEVTSVQMIDGVEVVCTNTKNFSVNASSLPEVSFTQTGFAGNGQVVINAQGSGDYEFALNDSGFTDSNAFDISQIENTIIVRDKNGCGEVVLNFIALQIPDFFTPNNDGINDFWQIKGIRQSENDVKNIFIFDRYGKLLDNISPLLIGWDGTYNGRQMPSQDYWYKIEMNSGQSVSGHFTLKR
ncbi:T9SS type B sorting domain-containing protein [Flavobacteriaceae bacterium 14752]|uniref:T9SS type B sorting domain-containing protein n=1 Tax=Mesohalobacter salilacus TaxID=2491711 RepID=UPI000F638332|nr:gliding motility-associated C-terminal domain-containing protein [Flavobacteriaceae bacterium 14752]